MRVLGFSWRTGANRHPGLILYILTYGELITPKVKCTLQSESLIIAYTEMPKCDTYEGYVLNEEKE